jgi:serine/threonine protein kinase
MPIDPAGDTFPAEKRSGGELPRGAQVGRYVVLDYLGRGGMGMVYAAYDPDLDRKVAIKLLHVGASETASEGESRLLREGQALARLQHPNVIAVHDVGTFQGQVFVAMEFVDGLTLRQWLQASPRGWREIAAVFSAAGHGLAAAHAAGLVHRDFKPENVLVGLDGRVRVLDFGLARIEISEAPEGAERNAAGSLTLTGAFLGTPAYMAPEQYARGTTDARTDQFSFCVTLYEALFGQRPFHGTTIAELELEVKRPPSPPSRMDIPDWLRLLVLRGLSANPEARFLSMEELLFALDADPESLARREAQAELHRRDREADPRVSNRARAYIAGGLGVVVASSVVWERLHPSKHHAINGRTMMIIFGLTVLVSAVPAFFARKHLLQNRISRQLVASIGVIYYVSVFMLYIAFRLGIALHHIAIISAYWGGACAAILGIALLRIFLWMALIMGVAGTIALALPEDALSIMSNADALAILVLMIAWLRTKPQPKPQQEAPPR